MNSLPGSGDVNSFYLYRVNGNGAHLFLGEEVKCPHCSFTTVSEVILGTHITSKHGEATLPCPLCSDRLPQKDLLEQHLFSTHNVNKAGAERLIAIIDTANWKPKEGG